MLEGCETNAKVVVTTQSMRLMLPAGKFNSVADAPFASNKAVKLEVVGGDRCEADK